MKLMMRRSIRVCMLTAAALGTFTSCGGGDGVRNASGRSSATIAWEPPQYRINGSPLSDTDLAGFKIYYTDASGVISRVIDVGMTASFTVDAAADQLPPQTYYFTVTAYDVLLRESDPSDVLAIALN